MLGRVEMEVLDWQKVVTDIDLVCVRPARAEE